ncbi:MAG TPA: hypothetical protein VKP88_01415, partial [Candidatus Paceibacterota bacterium]|nr:hypothetical protein [Candidatus Paceibacterota bacterium]
MEQERLDGRRSRSYQFCFAMFSRVARRTILNTTRVVLFVLLASTVFATMPQPSYTPETGFSLESAVQTAQAAGVSFTRVQSASAGHSNPPTATFGSTPTEGNLLVAIASERSGLNADDFTISGTGWTKVVSETVEQFDNNYRRTQAVWWKEASSTEPSSVTASASGNLTLLIQEFEADQAVTWSVIATTSDNTGTGSASPLNSGTTTSLSAESQLRVGAANWRNDSVVGSIDFSGLGSEI